MNGDLYCVEKSRKTSELTNRSSQPSIIHDHHTYYFLCGGNNCWPTWLKTWMVWQRIKCSTRELQYYYRWHLHVTLKWCADVMCIYNYCTPFTVSRGLCCTATASCSFTMSAFRCKFRVTSAGVRFGFTNTLVTKVKQESRAIAGRTARCRCKFWYVGLSNLTISR